MYKKRWKVYAWGLLLILIVLIFFFWPNSSKIINGENVTISYVGFVIQDFEVIAAFFAGILAFAAAMYASDRNFKAIKLSAIPDDSVNLLFDLKYLFKEHELSAKEGKEDYFILLINVLKYWKHHQKAFMLLTPHFYKNFSELMYGSEVIKDTDKTHVKNSKYIINAILTHISNSALEDVHCPFIFIIPELINDNCVIKEIGDISRFYTRFEFSKSNLIKYIDNIHGKNTKKYTYRKFNELNLRIRHLLIDLKEEIEEY